MEKEINAEILIQKVIEFTDSDKVLWSFTSDQNKYILSLKSGRIVTFVQYVDSPFEQSYETYSVDFLDNSGQLISSASDIIIESQEQSEKTLAKDLYQSIQNQITRINNKKLGLLYDDLV